MIVKFGLWTALLLTACSGASGDKTPGSKTGTDASPPGSGGQGASPGSGGSVGADSAVGTGGVIAGGTGGAVGTGGVMAAGCATGSGGSAGASVPDGGPALEGTATRPQLSDADAAHNTILEYLAQTGTLGALVTDPWDPTAGLGDVSTFTPTYTVAKSGGTHATVQAAIDAAILAGGTSRVYILVEPGEYREVVCVRTTVPITLYGADADASKVVIAYNNYAAKTKDANVNPCKPPNQTATVYGTGATATFAAYANGFQAKNLTISNDYPDNPPSQAVALLTSADKIVLENVRLLGNQDTFYIASGDPRLVTRLYFKDSYVEGDTDFVFGRGTAVLEGSTLNALSTKTGGTGIAPSTAPANDHGFLVINSNFTAAVGLAPNSTYLGRAWDESAGACYVPGTSPNGQALIRDSILGAHIRSAGPWASAATTKRPFSAAGNRLYEYKNTGPGAAP